MAKSKKPQGKRSKSPADALESKMAATEELARARPFNELKPAEFDPESQIAPALGINKTIAPLDRVRSDSAGQALTTN